MCTGFGRGGMRCFSLGGSDRLDGEENSLRGPWVSLDVDLRACHVGEKYLKILVFLSPLARM